jgi:uncharacterized membrane protein
MVHSQATNMGTVITLQPNRSATWAELRLFLFLICGTTLAVGLFWAFVGLWAILPFSGLEAALVAFVLYRVCQATYQRQVITCSPEAVIVQFGTQFPKRSWTLERARTRITVSTPRHPLDAPELRIYDQLNSIELGRFLNKDDKTLALQALKSAGLPVRNVGGEGNRDL